VTAKQLQSECDHIGVSSDPDHEVLESSVLCEFFEELPELESLRWRLSWLLGRRRPRCER
jgi:hypothetical protein